MWPMCTANNSWWLLLPFLLGLLTGLWAWWRSRTPAVLAVYEAPVVTAPVPAPTVTPAATPVVAPVATPAPAAFVALDDAGIGTGIGLAAAGGAVAAGLTAIGIPAAVGAADDLEVIKGIGPKLSGVLNGLGVTRFDQIANWTAGDVDKVDDHLGQFQNRIGREEWIPQAKLLAVGNTTEWQQIYGTVAKAAVTAGAAALTAIGIPAAVGAADDLLKIKGIGPKLNALLNSLGVTRFDQIAAWGAAEVDKVDDHLGTFKNRIDRDGWIEQAGLLARGEITAFEAKFGKLGSENK